MFEGFDPDSIESVKRDSIEGKTEIKEIGVK